MRIAVVIPAFNEAATVGEVVAGVRSVVNAAIIVVDGGSADETARRAGTAGAEVIVERRRGYGRACQAGVEHARTRGAAILAFLDAAGAEDPADLPRVLAPIETGAADFVVGTRVLATAEPGALRPAQRAGNALATWLIARLHGHRYTDLGSMRAIGIDALDALDMGEAAHGWPVEMQVKAARRGLRIVEVPIHYRRRRHGRSKVSGSLGGAVRAGAAIVRVVLTGGG